MPSPRIIPTEFESDGETIRGAFVVPDGNGPYPGICKFHGLPGSNDQTGGIASRLADAGFIVLTFDFRGFRESEGLFSLSGEILDAQNAITHLLDSDLSENHWTGVYGASFGGAVGICTTAIDERVKALCVRAPVFDTDGFVNSDRIRAALAWIGENTDDVIHGSDDEQTMCKMIERLAEDTKEYNPIEMVERVSPRPLYIITGDDDILISVEGVKKLYERAREPKELTIIEGADHALSSEESFEETAKAIIDWFRSVGITYDE